MDRLRWTHATIPAEGVPETDADPPSFDGR